jgi:hypothetical protein
MRLVGSVICKKIKEYKKEKRVGRPGISMKADKTKAYYRRKEKHARQNRDAKSSNVVHSRTGKT